jgi:hypothetical protein
VRFIDGTVAAFKAQPSDGRLRGSAVATTTEQRLVALADVGITRCHKAEVDRGDLLWQPLG